MYTAYIKKSFFLHFERHIHLYVLCDLLPFVQFQKHEKHRWRKVTFS